jgi:hypothetical protein
MVHACPAYLTWWGGRVTAFVLERGMQDALVGQVSDSTRLIIDDKYLSILGRSVLSAASLCPTPCCRA